MKKLFALFVTTFVVSTAVFADIGMGAWMGILPTPVAYDGKDFMGGMTNSWWWSGGGARIARLDIYGGSPDGKVGMQMGVYGFAAGEWGPSDWMFMWVQPFDQVKFVFGKFDTDWYSDDIGLPDMEWLRSGAYLDEDSFFSGNIYTTNRFALEIYPVQGLTLFATVGLPGDFTQIKSIYKKVRAGIWYDIPRVGALRIQWRGMDRDTIKNIAENFGGTDDDNGEERYIGDIQAEFDFTMVDKLDIKLAFAYGIKQKGFIEAMNPYWELPYPYRTLKGMEEEQWRKMKIALGVSYQVIHGLKLQAVGQMWMFDKVADMYDVAPRFSAGIGATYTIFDGLNAMATVRYLSATKFDGNSLGDSAISFMAGVTLRVGSNGSIGIAFEGLTNGGSVCDRGSLKGVGFYPTDDFDNRGGMEGHDGKFAWAIPLMFTVGI